MTEQTSNASPFDPLDKLSGVNVGYLFPIKYPTRADTDRLLELGFEFQSEYLRKEDKEQKDYDSWQLWKKTA